MLFRQGALHLVPIAEVVVGARVLQQASLLSGHPKARPSWVEVRAALFSLVLAGHSLMAPEVVVVSWAHLATQAALR